MKKIVVIVIAVLLFVVSAPSSPAQTFTLTIWVDKGCGGEYFVGDMLTVYWRASHACEITFWEVEPDGVRRKLTTQAIITGAGEGSRGWTLKDYGYGRRAVQAQATSPFGSDSAECEYFVLKRAADIVVKVTDQDGVPISGASVLLDDTAAASTDADGSCTIQEVEFGEHMVTVKVGDEEQSSRIRIASTENQYLDFVFTVEKRGFIKVQVHDQDGNPLEADVFVDGYKEGRTTADGEFTVSASEGSHHIEVRWQNEKASDTVTVVRDQTSFADLVIQVERETTVSVLVQDSTGRAVADAIVYVDNIFLGRTDAQGVVKERATPGARTVRVEKQGYQSTTQDVIVQEGENSLTVTITEEDVPLYGWLVILGFLWILKRRSPVKK